MCGIAAVVGTGSHVLPEEAYHTFRAPLKFRGPDDKGMWHHRSGEHYASLFHTRLSIIDLNSTGHQPMISPSGGTAIIYNGEIYNYKILRRELEERGRVFVSNSDTEVLLHGFELWGMEDLLKKIDGMFAFLLYDVADHRAYLARDRFGKKPLYYAQHQGALVVSSDIRSFYRVPSLNLTIDAHSAGYFFYEFSTPRTQSIWREIKKLPAAHYAVFADSHLSMHPYWRLKHTESNRLSWNETVSKAEALLQAAVKKRLVADVPVAAQLSGGIDSSLVVAMMAACSGSKVKTYNVRFDDRTIDESPFARQVATRFGTEHTEVNVSAMDIEVIDQVIAEFGEPFADSSMLPTYQVCREIARHEKVVCGGDGGDELFGGYFINHFTHKLDQVKSMRWLHHVVRRLPLPRGAYRLDLLRDLLQSANRPAFELLHRHMGFSHAEMKAIFAGNTVMIDAMQSEHAEVWRQFGNVSPSGSCAINVLAAFLRTRLENDYLVKVDRASMFASLEMRSPFLDKDLAEFAATLRRSDLYATAGPKSVLKALASKYFSHDFVHRRKQGFGVPLNTWLRGFLRQRFVEVVFDNRQQLIPFHYQYVRDIFDKHQQGEDHAEKLWPVYVFHRWAQQLNE